MTDRADRAGAPARGWLFAEGAGRGGPAGPPGPAPGQIPSPRLGSEILLRRRYHGSAPPTRPDFDYVSHGYDTDEVDRYLAELIEWARGQTQRADSAEQMLRAALAQLRPPPAGRARRRAASAVSTLGRFVILRRCGLRNRPAATPTTTPTTTPTATPTATPTRDHAEGELTEFNGIGPRDSDVDAGETGASSAGRSRWDVGAMFGREAAVSGCKVTAVLGVELVAVGAPVALLAGMSSGWPTVGSVMAGVGVGVLVLSALATLLLQR